MKRRKRQQVILLSLAPPEVRVCVSADITVNTTASIQVSADAGLN